MDTKIVDTRKIPSVRTQIIGSVVVTRGGIGMAWVGNNPNSKPIELTSVPSAVISVVLQKL